VLGNEPIPPCEKSDIRVALRDISLDGELYDRIARRVFLHHRDLILRFAQRERHSLPMPLEVHIGRGQIDVHTGSPVASIVAQGLQACVDWQAWPTRFPYTPLIRLCLEWIARPA